MKYLESRSFLAGKQLRRFSQFLCTGLALLVPLAVSAQKPAPATPQSAPPAERKLPLSERKQVTLADVNVDISSDPRVIAMTAALNAAGYDYEPGNRALTALRQQLRTEVKISPDLARRITDHLTRHGAKQAGGKLDAASIAPYLSLALSLTAPPVFSIDVPVERLPEDVREITDFALLLEEFYRESHFGSLLPKYVKTYERAAFGYGIPTAQAVGDVLAYLHTEPILELPPLYIPRVNPTGQTAKKQEVQSVTKLPNRERRFVVVPDLLNASNAVNLRVIRDTYYLLIGPGVDPADAVRRGYLRFVVDPLVERQLKDVAAINNNLKKLFETRGDKADPEYRKSAYFLIADSLTRAANARLSFWASLSTRRFADEKSLKQALDEAEERSIYDLSFAYERGAVLVYHFYDQVKAFETAGINLRDYLGSMLQNIQFDKEATRLTDYAQRIARYKAGRESAAASAGVLEKSISNSDQQVIAQLDEADRLIQGRQYAQAKAILSAVRQQRPNNARALFGLADVHSKLAQGITDKDRLDEELYASVQLYRDAAQNASPETEKWLIQRSYVAAAKILDFLEQYDDATAAYDLAIKMGDVPQGALEEAQKDVKKRQEKKEKQ